MASVTVTVSSGRFGEITIERNTGSDAWRSAPDAKALVEETLRAIVRDVVNTLDVEAKIHA